MRAGAMAATAILVQGVIQGDLAPEDAKAAAEKQRREFLEKHGQSPTREIVIQFV